MRDLLVFLAYVAASAVCASVTVCALAYPFIKAYRIFRGR